MDINEIRAARQAAREAQAADDARALAHAKANPLTNEERESLKPILEGLNS